MEKNNRSKAFEPTLPITYCFSFDSKMSIVIHLFSMANAFLDERL